MYESYSYFGKHGNQSAAIDSSTAPLDDTYAYIGGSANYFEADTTFDGDVFTDTVQISNGTSYNENIRMFPSASNDYSSIIIGAVSGTSGTGDGQWTLVRYPDTTYDNKFAIRHNTTDIVTITKNTNTVFAGDVKATNFYSVANAADGGFTDNRDYAKIER